MFRRWIAVLVACYLAGAVTGLSRRDPGTPWFPTIACVVAPVVSVLGFLKAMPHLLRNDLDGDR